MKSPLNIAYRAVHPMVRVSKDLQRCEEDEALKHKHQTLDPQKSFIAVKRLQIGRNGEVIRLQIKGYDRGQYDGFWVNEYTRYGSRTIHCLPAEHLNALSGPVSPEKLLMVANFPILQRWVGVQYHPETEIESHYGEMSVAKCYDLDPLTARRCKKHVVCMSCFGLDPGHPWKGSVAKFNFSSDHMDGIQGSFCGQDPGSGCRHDSSAGRNSLCGSG